MVHADLECRVLLAVPVARIGSRRRPRLGRPCDGVRLALDVASTANRDLDRPEHAALDRLAVGPAATFDLLGPVRGVPAARRSPCGGPRAPANAWRASRTGRPLSIVTVAPGVILHDDRAHRRRGIGRGWSAAASRAVIGRDRGSAVIATAAASIRGCAWRIDRGRVERSVGRLRASSIATGTLAGASIERAPLGPASQCSDVRGIGHVERRDERGIRHRRRMRAAQHPHAGDRTRREHAASATAPAIPPPPRAAPAFGDRLDQRLHRRIVGRERARPIRGPRSRAAASIRRAPWPRCERRASAGGFCCRNVRILEVRGELVGRIPATVGRDRASWPRPPRARRARSGRSPSCGRSRATDPGRPPCAA